MALFYLVLVHPLISALALKKNSGLESFLFALSPIEWVSTFQTWTGHMISIIFSMTFKTDLDLWTHDSTTLMYMTFSFIEMKFWQLHLSSVYTVTYVSL